MSKKISIIVPIYNAGIYLKECIESILLQTFDDFELILVNDGSTDNSLEICHNYKEKDNRITILNKNNGGVSSARNLGLQTARGEWITFIDSDDHVDKNYLDNLIKEDASDIDLIMTGIHYFDIENNKDWSERLSSREITISSDTGAYDIATMPLITSPVSKLYRKDIILNNEIQFDRHISFGEDRDFNLKYISFIKKAKSSIYIGYNYRKGLSHSLSSDRDYLKLLMWDLEYYKKLSEFFHTKYSHLPQFIDNYLTNRLFNFINDRIIEWKKNNKITYHDFHLKMNEILTKPEIKNLKREIIHCTPLNKFKLLFHYCPNLFIILYYYLRF